MRPTKTELAAYLDDLDSGAADPRKGLPDPVFQFVLKTTPMINVDLLVKDGLGRVLVAWRSDEFGEGWHIPGGIIRWRESFAARLAAVGRLELHAEVAPDPEPCRVSQLLDSGRGHFISLLYRCVLRTPIPDDAFAADASDAQPGQLLWSSGVPAALYPAHEIYRDLFAA
jgi:hypothetical protein